MFNYVNFNPGNPFGSFNNYGGSGSFTWNVSRWVGLTEELGGLSYNRTVNGISNSGGTTTFLLGPRLNMRKFDYFVPFAEFLLGGAHAGPPMTGNTSQTSFALVAGGGVDIVLSKNIAWRFAEIDYLMTNFSGASLGGNARQDNLRLGTGIVLRFGLPKEAPPPPVNQPPVAACSANPTSVFAGSGDTVAIHVNASDPDNDPLTYSLHRDQRHGRWYRPRRALELDRIERGHLYRDHPSQRRQGRHGILRHGYQGGSAAEPSADGFVGG